MKLVPLASAALMVAAPSPPAERPQKPCPPTEGKAGDGAASQPKLLRPERPSVAQRHVPGLF